MSRISDPQHMNLSHAVYLDYAATTPVDPRVAQRMAACLTLDASFANPASDSHLPGRAARELVEEARLKVAALINASPEEIIWTSGATESDNLAIAGAARFHRHERRHIVTTRTEHKAVLDTCRQLEREGFDVSYLVPDRFGHIELRQLQEALREDTVLVSIMHVNNETGVVQELSEIGALCRERGILFHVDAAQSAGKIPIDVKAMCVDLMSFSAHKVYGPKGAGALYVSRAPLCRLSPLMYGGGQERGLRPGTLATHQIVGMGEAFRIAKEELDQEGQRLGRRRDRLWCGLQTLPGVEMNGHPTLRAPGILNVCFPGVEGEALLFALRPLAVSSGSACNSSSGEASYVLRAMGRSDQLAQSSLRFSLGRFTTEEDIDYVIELTTRQVERLRSMAPKQELSEDEGCLALGG